MFGVNARWTHDATNFPMKQKKADVADHPPPFLVLGMLLANQDTDPSLGCLFSFFSPGVGVRSELPGGPWLPTALQVLQDFSVCSSYEHTRG